jgi:hypothetical protein
MDAEIDAKAEKFLELPSVLHTYSGDEMLWNGFL